MLVVGVLARVLGFSRVELDESEGMNARLHHAGYFWADSRHGLEAARWGGPLFMEGRRVRQ